MRTIAVAFSIGALFLGINTATAGGPPPVDASSCTIACQAVNLKFGFKPALVFQPALPVADAIKVKGTVSDCTVSGATCTGAHLAVSSGKVTGTLNTTTNDCVTLLGTNGVTGSLVVKWKTASGSPKLADPTSTQTPSSITIGSFTTPWEVNGYTMVSTGGITITGSFHGGDAGNSSVIESVPSPDLNGILSTCQGASGLKSLTAGLGTVQLQ